MKATGNVRFTVHFDGRVMQLLDRLAEEYDGNRSMTLRKAVREYAARRNLHNVGAQEPERVQREEVQE